MIDDINGSIAVQLMYFFYTILRLLKYDNPNPSGLQANAPQRKLISDVRPAQLMKTPKTPKPMMEGPIKHEIEFMQRSKA